MFRLTACGFVNVLGHLFLLGSELLLRGGKMLLLGSELLYCIATLRCVKGRIEQLRYTDLRNVCSMAIAKTQQEYTLAQAR